ncbi:DinB family protein [Winogradskyella sp.]|nr:DinB family protein [Winogradskyella sp.]MDA8874374.1 DinB family protein [Winogradskyella sp.]
MKTSEIEKLKYPIGEFKTPDNITKAHINTWISDIETFPNSIETETKTLSEAELNYNYRPNGWNIRQVVHHCADSHINCITRFKLVLTDDAPTIRAYYEDRWATLADYEQNINTALDILKGVHAKLCILLRS